MQITEDEISTIIDQQSALLTNRLDDEARVLRILTTLADMIGARCGFACFFLGNRLHYIPHNVGPQIAAYLDDSFRGFDASGNILLADPDLEEINRRRRALGPGVHHEGRLQLRERIVGTSYHREAFTPAGMHHVIGLTAPLPVGEAIFAFGFDGADDPGFVNARNIKLLRLVLPAFQSAFGTAFARAQRQYELEAALAQVPRVRVEIGARPNELPGLTVLPGPDLPGGSVSWISVPTGANPEPTGVAEIARLNGLSPRQSEVFCLMLDGLSTPEIARSLGISHNTARRHTEAVLNRLGLRSRRALWPFVSAQS